MWPMGLLFVFLPNFCRIDSILLASTGLETNVLNSPRNLFLENPFFYDKHFHQTTKYINGKYSLIMI